MQVSSSALPLLPDGESFHDSLYCEKCQCFLPEPCWQHAVLVQDGYSLPLAFASLPDVLAFHNDDQHQNVLQPTDNSTCRGPSVVARTAILAQTVFGPFIAPVCDAGVAHSRTFSSSDGQCVTFSLENDRWCNWMKLVRTVDHGQHNLRVFIRQHKVLFVAVKVILPGEELTLTLYKHDRKEIHDNDLHCAPMDCVSGGTDDGCSIKCEDDANGSSAEILLCVPATSFSAAAQPLAQPDPLDLLPLSQPLPLEPNQEVSDAQPALSTFHREDSPEYPFPSSFPASQPMDAMAEEVALQPNKSEGESEAAVLPKRSYSLRSRNGKSGSTPYNDPDAFDSATDDDNFQLSADAYSSSSASDRCSESESDLTETAQNRAKERRLRTRPAKQTNPAGGKVRGKRKTNGTTPKGKRTAKHFESICQQVKAVIAVNPFQYPAGEQRWQAYSAAADMLSPDLLSRTKKLAIDGQLLRTNTQSRLREFEKAENSNRTVGLPTEYIALMKQLVELRGRSKTDENIRKLKAVIQVNPFQFSSASECRVAWKVACQSYMDEDADVDKPEENFIKLRKYVQLQLDDYPRLLDRYNDAVADDKEREYMQLLQVIVKLAGKDYGGDVDSLNQQKDGDAADANAATGKKLVLTRPRPKKKGYQHDTFFPSYIYRFVCWECSVHFKDENLLKLHELQHTDSSGEAAGSRDCPVCERSFDKLTSLLLHVLDHSVKAAQITHYIPTADPNILSFASKTAAPMDVLAQNHDAHETCFMYSCGVKYCGLRFCTESLCDLHQLSHNVPDNYQGDVFCAACSFQAENARDLLNHVGRHAAKVNDRKLCRMCGEFVEHMAQHVQYMHKEAYLQYEARLAVSCDQCEKRLRTPIHLATHKLYAHKNIQGFRCLVCAKQFPNSHQLYAHTKQEHKEGLTCMVCKKSYRKYVALYSHARTHKEVHVCDTCGSVFRLKINLDRHQITHRSDYSFKCDLCGKSFKRSSNLGQHKMVVHTDKVRKQRKAKRDELRRMGVVSDYKCPRQKMRYEEFPYKCEECRLGWMLLGNLQQHQRKKHSQSDANVQSAKSHPVSSSSGSFN
ncbi:uncharacterized protein LOC129585458 [Paramacrobiotus metropolitanus]|uniref:uncharacterized protein LOC129585458 n=1 Tax=Paramacrobiotus metropolitanus TaxID=2943436 RepID=UPI0024461410|nr:uncharacterized protein LOC129585458 [Paramacrobiotus metropolitanus]